jgi:hypothetical protein
MSYLGKIFIYEKNPDDLKYYESDFRRNGFFVFGTNNLYLLTQYAKEMKPDIVIINLPQSLHPDDNTFKNIEESLCNTENCPDIYINTDWNFKHKDEFHLLNFISEDLTPEQIFNVVNQSSLTKH